MVTAAIALGLGLIATTLCVGAGYAIGRRRSLPVLRPGMHLSFRTENGWTLTHLILTEYSVNLSKGHEVRLESMEHAIRRTCEEATR